jgi:hypothetical protein
VKNLQKNKSIVLEKLVQNIQNKVEYLLHFEFGDMMNTSIGIGKEGMTYA